MLRRSGVVVLIEKLKNRLGGDVRGCCLQSAPCYLSKTSNYVWLYMYDYIRTVNWERDGRDEWEGNEVAIDALREVMEGLH